MNSPKESNQVRAYLDAHAQIIYRDTARQPVELGSGRLLNEILFIRGTAPAFFVRARHAYLRRELAARVLPLYEDLVGGAAYVPDVVVEALLAENRAARAGLAERFKAVNPYRASDEPMLLCAFEGICYGPYVERAMRNSCSALRVLTGVRLVDEEAALHAYIEEVLP